MARENNRKLALDKALEYHSNASFKQLSPEEFMAFVNNLYLYLTNKTSNGKQQFK